MGSTAELGLGFIVVLQLFMFLASQSVENINPSAHIYSTDGSLFSGSGEVSSDDIVDSLPSVDAPVEPPSGIFFTDSFSSMRSWITKVPGLNFLYNMLVSPYVLLSYTGLPQVFVYGIGSAWYILMLFAVVALMWGRQ